MKNIKIEIYCLLRYLGLTLTMVFAFIWFWGCFNFMTLKAHADDELSIPLTFELAKGVSNGQISIISPYAFNMKYSVNNGEKKYIESRLCDTNDFACFIHLNAGETIQLYGIEKNNQCYNNTHIICYGDCMVYGNIMSLIDERDYETNTTLETNNTFARLFANNTTLKSHPTKKLALPATTLAEGCYYGMFSGCTNITEAPELPATTLAKSCYSQMFSGCTNITEAPELPAATLADHCYFYMFSGCTNITEAPELPATTLADYCYSNMFYGCTNLTEAPELPATTLADYCYSGMFHSCKNLTEAPELPATTLADYCYSDMFYYCTNLTEAPELPATTLADYCYSNMFSNCTNLTEAPELPATTLADYCYYRMFSYCTNLIKAQELPATTLADYCCYEMFYNCTNLIKAPELPATTLADHCYSYMFYNCTNLTEAPELPATTLADYCCYEMFYNCTNLTEAPEELPATTLADHCYSGMFHGCTNLTEAPELPATTLADYCYSGMFSGCISLTEAPELTATAIANNCYSGMFSGCTELKKIIITAQSKYPSGYKNIFTDFLKNASKTGIIISKKYLKDTLIYYSLDVGWRIWLIQEVKAPEAIDNLLYNGKAQTLVTEAKIINDDGNTSNDSIKYSLDNVNWSTEVPKATEIGNYTVYYKVEGKDSYLEYIGNPVTVTIFDELELEQIIISSQPINSEVGINEQAFFNIRAIGERLTYLWQYKKRGDDTWQDWTNMTSSEISIEYSPENNGMLLRCVITDKFGRKIISDEAELTYRHAHQYEEIPYKAATCIEEGNEVYYICKFAGCDLLFSDINGSTITSIPTIPVDCDNHLWGETTYTWSDDNGSVTAKRVCAYDPEHVETEVVETISKTIKPATCYETGIVEFTSLDFENSAFDVQTRTIEIPAGHDWEDVIYSWSEENDLVTAIRTCKNDSSHVQAEMVSVIESIEKTPTCEEAGIKRYVTDTFKNPEFSSQTKTEEIPALGHAWGKITYTWNSDNSKVTAIRVCQNDSDHVEAEIVSTYEDIEEPSCETAGTRRILTEGFNNSAFKIQSKTFELPAIGHEWGSPTYIWSEDNSQVTAIRVCRNNDEHMETEAVTTTKVIKTSEEGNKYEEYSAVFSNDAFEIQTKIVELVATPKNGDVNGDGVVNAKDVTTLRRHLAGGWSVTIVDANSDINGDGTINAKDVTMLRRALAGGWGIVLE